MGTITWKRIDPLIIALYYDGYHRVNQV